MQGAWKPLLEGDPAREARRVIDELAAALRDAAEETSADGPKPSLADGDAGLALFFAYLSEVDSDGDAAELACTFLDRSLSALESTTLPPGLFSGFTGVAWTLEHLNSRLFLAEPEDESPNVQIDDALTRWLSQPVQPGEFDLISGLVGFGIYALEALPRPTARDCLGMILRRLEEIAEPTDRGTTWFTPPELVGINQRALYPEGYYNLGVAHGVPGIIAFLSEAGVRDVGGIEIEGRLEEAVKWVTAQELSASAESRFPYWLARGKELEPARLAWCYGDPGVAVALLLAARAARRADWEETALRLARFAAERPPESAKLVDAGLCHGAAGLGHLFNRLFQATKDPLLADAARDWFGRTLAMRRPGEGLAGYLAYDGTPGDVGWRPEKGFLTGAAGIGLALLGAISTVEPEWDRALLTAVSPLP